MKLRSKSALLLCGAIAPLAVSSAAQAQASPSPFTWATRFDVERRVTGTIAPDPDGAGPLKFAAVRNTYDAAGRLTKVEKGELASWQSESVAPSAWGTSFTVLQVIDTTYDSADRKLKETLSGGNPLAVQTFTQFSYDNLGRLQCTAVRMNPGQFASPPASACTKDTAGSFGADRVTRNVYDDAGQLLQVREGVGTSVEAAEATYSYTPNGHREFVIDGEGNRAKFVYDGHDRVTQWHFPSKTKAAAFDDSTPANALASAGAVNAADFEQYGYDANGNRTSLRKRDGRTIGYSFDALNRMIFKNWPATTGGDVTYAYDLRGLQLSAIVGSGLGITNAYDGFGQLTSSTSDMGGIVRTMSYQYDANGNRTRITHPDGQFFTYDYDGLDRMKGILEGASTTLVSIAYDPFGRRSSLARSGAGTTTYGYDDASRLSSLTHDLAGTANDLTIAFGDATNPGYNPASQIIRQTRSKDVYAFTGHGSGSTATGVNGLNQIATKGGTAFTYDANGNLTSDGTWTYTYDVENRVTNASSAAGGVNLFYDPLGRLWRVTGGLVTDVHLLHDGDQLALEYNIGGGAVRYRFVHGPGVDEPLLQYDGATLGTKRHFHADHQGSIIALTDASGTSIATNRYDEYGVPEGTNSGRFGYTGQVWLKEIGLNYYKARMYSPPHGVFLQTDPVGYDDQINLYAYVGNDPVNMVDPNGRDAIMLSQKDGSKVLIIPVRFVNATAGQKREMMKAYNSIVVKGGEYKTVAIETESGIKGTLNTVTLTKGPPSQCLGNSACANELGGNQIFINSQSEHIDDFAAHEFPHTASIPDQYEESFSDGKRITTPKPGFEGNTMGRIIKRELTSDQMRAAESGPNTKKCTGNLTNLGEIQC